MLRSVGLLLGSLIICACGGGGGSGSSDGGAAQVTSPEISSLNPASITVEIDQSATSDETISFTNSGTATLTYSVTAAPSWLTILSGGSGSVAVGGTGQATLRIDCSQGSQSGEVVITTNVSGQGETTIPVVLTCTESNYEIARLILNQASRAFDSDEGAAMQMDALAGRDMLVRVFVTGSGPVPQGDVVMVSAGAETRFPLTLPNAISAILADESLLDASHYAIIPGAAVPAGAELYVEVDGARYPQTNLDLEVADPGVLGITLVPVTFAGQTPTLDADTYLRQTLQQLPIGQYDVTIRTPYLFAGPYDLDELLDDITDLRTADGSNNLYHGVIIPPPASGAQTAGLGYVGFPVSISIDLNGQENVISHEIGHNFDLGHAPACDAPNTDPDYPNADGAVTNWGYDIRNRVLVEPTATKKDLMSYCNDVWISRYNFAKAMQFRVSAPPTVLGLGGVAEKALAIRGRLVRSGVSDISFMSGTGLMRLAKEANPSHRITAWDKNGTQLLDTVFTPYNVEHGREGESVFVVTVPEPASNIDHYTISEIGGAVVASENTEETSGLQIADGSVQWQDSPGYRVMMRNSDGEVVRIAKRSGESIPEQVSSVELMGPGAIKRSGNRTHRLILD